MKSKKSKAEFLKIAENPQKRAAEKHGDMASPVFFRGTFLMAYGLNQIFTNLSLPTPQTGQR